MPENWFRRIGILFWPGYSGMQLAGWLGTAQEGKQNNSSTEITENELHALKHSTAHKSTFECCPSSPNSCLSEASTRERKLLFPIKSIVKEMFFLCRLQDKPLKENLPQQDCSGVCLWKRGWKQPDVVCCFVSSYFSKQLAFSVSFAVNSL